MAFFFKNNFHKTVLKKQTKKKGKKYMKLLLDKDISAAPTLWKAIVSFFGLGRIHANYACIKAVITRKTPLINLTRTNIRSLDRILRKRNWIVGRMLERDMYLSTNNLVEINAYRAMRARQGLPLRGQRTHSNAKTARRLSGLWDKTTFAKRMKKQKALKHRFNLSEHLKLKRKEELTRIMAHKQNQFLEQKRALEHRQLLNSKNNNKPIINPLNLGRFSKTRDYKINRKSNRAKNPGHTNNKK